MFPERTPSRPSIALLAIALAFWTGRATAQPNVPTEKDLLAAYCAADAQRELPTDLCFSKCTKPSDGKMSPAETKSCNDCLKAENEYGERQLSKARRLEKYLRSRGYLDGDRRKPSIAALRAKFEEYFDDIRSCAQGGNEACGRLSRCKDLSAFPE